MATQTFRSNPPGPHKTHTRRGKIKRIAFRLFLLAALAFGVPSEGWLGKDRARLAVMCAGGQYAYDLLGWEAEALAQKVRDGLQVPAAAAGDASGSGAVRRYFDQMLELARLDARITRIYSQRAQTDPSSEVVETEQRRLQLRREHAELRPAAEWQLQQQTAEAIRATGLSAGAIVWPPVRLRFSESPDAVVLSPRPLISYIRGIHLTPGLPLSEIERIEAEVDRETGLSTLVEGTGGFSTYPTMIVEYPALDWVLETIAHEWGHTYLVFFPLGWHYFDNSDLRTLNETAVSIIGEELAAQVIATHYPDTLAVESAGERQERGDLPEAFDYYRTMRQTRLEVDRLLREGNVAGAEAFMESQRELFVSHGYALRKLNQAYFAFHGSYAAGPGATDPIGAKLRSLRANSVDLAHFVAQVRGLRSVEDLDRLLNGSTAGDGRPAVAAGPIR